VDAYIGPHCDVATKAYVVHQRKPDGKGYDEDKVMLGFKNKKEAKEAYLKHYDSPKFLGPISIVTMDRLRDLVARKKQLVKISHVACLEELNKLAEGPQPPVSKRTIKKLRKAGPGLGGATGAVVGALLGLKKGQLLKSTMAGLGTGATLGWTPDMYLSAKEALTSRRRK
jgi:hypothetical protein